MKHAVLGIGGVGGLVAALLAKSGQQVDAIVRPQVLAAHPNHILIDQPTGPETFSQRCLLSFVHPKRNYDSRRQT
jgi:ketopantoate reductase